MGHLEDPYQVDLHIKIGPHLGLLHIWTTTKCHMFLLDVREPVIFPAERRKAGLCPAIQVCLLPTRFVCSEAFLPRARTPLGHAAAPPDGTAGALTPPF